MKDFVPGKNNTNRLENIPILREFCEMMHTNQITDISLIQKDFERFASEFFLKDLVNCELTKLSAVPWYFPQNSSYNVMEVVETKTFNIILLNMASRDQLNKHILTCYSTDWNCNNKVDI